MPPLDKTEIKRIERKARESSKKYSYLIWVGVVIGLIIGFAVYVYLFSLNPYGPHSHFLPICLPWAICTGIGYALYYKKVKEKAKILIEEQKNRENIAKESERRNAEEFQRKKAKAKELLNDAVFLKLYNTVNKANLDFANDPNKMKAVYNCYPYNSFYISKEGIGGWYYEHSLTASNFEIKYKNLLYSDVGIIENITDEKAELIAMAFGMTKGYVHKGYVYTGSSCGVEIDKAYWNAPKSVDDILAIIGNKK